MKICPKCNLEHIKIGKFCSRKCANSRIFTAEANKKKSESNKKYANSLSIDERRQKAAYMIDANSNISSGPYTKIKLKFCTHCNIQFWSHNLNTISYSTTCSDNCYLSVKRKNRAGSKTFYKGELYDSRWEVDVAKWLDELNIEYIRPKKHILWIDKTGKNRKYFPDFYLPSLDLFVDPKNKFCIISQQEKLNYVKTKINLVYGEVKDIKEVIIKMKEQLS